MGFKRKRSSSVLSPFSSSSSATISSRDPSTSPCPDVLMLNNPEGIYPYPESAPSHLDSRTKKRYRDNRPDEAIIHGMSECESRPLPFSCTLNSLLSVDVKNRHTRDFSLLLDLHLLQRTRPPPKSSMRGHSLTSVSHLFTTIGPYPRHLLKSLSRQP